MSPFAKSVILDNDCISNFQIAGVLEKFLRFWSPGNLNIPQRVLNEARAWPEHGSKVCEIIERLANEGQVNIIDIDDTSEEEISAYMELRMREPVLGEGESECMAIAKNRNYIVVSNDTTAREHCNTVFPEVEIVNTLGMIKMAKDDGLIPLGEVGIIWDKIRKERRR